MPSTVSGAKYNGRPYYYKMRYRSHGDILELIMAGEIHAISEALGDLKASVRDIGDRVTRIDVKIDKAADNSERTHLDMVELKTTVGDLQGRYADMKTQFAAVDERSARVEQWQARFAAKLGAWSMVGAAVLFLTGEAIHAGFEWVVHYFGKGE